MPTALCRLAQQILMSVVLIIFPLTMVGCDHYTVTLNDRRIYTPPSLFNDFELTDPNLQQCVMQTIADKMVKLPEQLTLLRCTYAGIVSLEGLEVFTGLKQLDLSNNEITSLAPLATASNLHRVKLKSNAVVELAPAFNWLKLQQLDISDNTEINCREVAQLAETSQAELISPKHCRE